MAALLTPDVRFHKDMIDKEKLHEKETLSFILSMKIEGQQAIDFYESMGLTLEDNFFFLDRSEPDAPWQSISMVTIATFLNDIQVYPDESGIDCLKFSYLFASLPESCFEEFKDVIQKTMNRFDGHLFYNHKAVSLGELDSLFDKWKKDLKSELDEKPGTESLAILIQELFYQ
ncbi:MAG: hypothetical protein K9L59_07935 [Desulfobacterales bacterium]|nr:hypothetical protein [Desulfobacterales bacterium]